MTNLYDKAYWLEVLMVNIKDTTSGSLYKVTVENLGSWGLFKF
jgi:hypothetical protein